MSKQYDMVFEIGNDIIRQFNFDANLLGDRGLLDYDFKMQIRASPTTPVILELSRQNSRIVNTHSRVYLQIDDTVIFDLSGLPTGYVTEPLPSTDDPTTVYGPYAYYDLKSYNNGIVTTELRGKIGFKIGITV